MLSLGETLLEREHTDLREVGDETRRTLLAG